MAVIGVWLLTFAGCAGRDWPVDSLVPPTLLLAAAGLTLIGAIAAAVERAATLELSSLLSVVLGSWSIGGATYLLFAEQEPPRAIAGGLLAAGLSCVVWGTVRAADSAAILATLSAMWALGAIAVVVGVIEERQGQHADPMYGQGMDFISLGGPAQDVFAAFVCIVGLAGGVAGIQGLVIALAMDSRARRERP